MIHIHKDTYVPQYRNGTWKWNDTDKVFEFVPIYELAQEQEEYLLCEGFKYKKTLNQVDEVLFRSEFERSEISHDADVILIQDIKNLVLFLSPAEMMRRDFLCFLHTEVVDRLLNSLIIYFEYFLKLVEMILIRRDETTGPTPKIQSKESLDMKYIFSSHLLQYRLILAREYAEIVLGNGELDAFYFITPLVKIPRTRWDSMFHEQFLSFATQIVWIAMHRRAYDVIVMEMERLFRTEHFMLQQTNPLYFNPSEASMLYGINYKRRNFRVQNSPLIQELMSVSKHNLPFLRIGEQKYRGTDLRVHQVELEYIVPPSQLALIDVTHGILGHPKKLYNTLLALNQDAVRSENFSETNDPYRLFRQPCIKIPPLDSEKMRYFAKKLDSYYKVVARIEIVSEETLIKWCKREEIRSNFNVELMVISSFDKSAKDVESNSYGPTAEEIIEKFIAKKTKLRKIKELEEKKDAEVITFHADR
ncbi:uncharacterized protein LOC119689790 [Teleopsis dalmanni]|uniref:uncharacterized protein LOC119689790 n=1 Tax=Teleopsis dalmanni TaxID=139649 RepID=UPI0018CF0F3D|nr:uncharacterized protein LOC119689790 [Teleopsis dalmanni]